MHASGRFLAVAKTAADGGKTLKYARSMYLLSLLYSSADDSRKQKLGKLFQEIVIKTSEYQQLSKYLQTVKFFGIDGRSKYDESQDTIRSAVSDIQNAAEHIQHIGLLARQIGNELTRSDALLSSARFFDEDFIAVKAEDVDVYNRFFKTLANAICYYLISQFGVKAIRNLTFNHRAGFQDVIRLVNQQYANELAMSASTMKPSAWAIGFESYYGDNLAGYCGYRITYSQQLDSDFLKLVQAGAYIRVSPYLYVAASSAVEAPLIGFGNLVGVEAMNVLPLLEASITTSLPEDIFGERDIEFADILGEIARSLQSKCYCVTPEDLVAALNRWSLVKTVNKRRQSKKCIFCGKDLGDGRVACASHFSIND